MRTGSKRRPVQKEQDAVWILGIGRWRSRARSREEKRQILGNQKGLQHHAWVPGLPPPWKTELVYATTD